jgi:drug/metabolite transporter (DMT)-like permease
MTLDRPLAITGVVLLMIVWGSTFVVTKAAASEIPPLTLAALRFFVAAVVLVPIALARGGQRRLPRPVPYRALLLMSLSGIVLYTVAFNFALLYASATQGALIYALLPGAIALAAVLVLKERPTLQRSAGIVLSLCGVALVIATGEESGSSPRPLLGAIWMLAAVAAWTAYTIIAKRLAEADQVIVITAVTVLGVLILLPLASVELLQSEWRSPSRSAWLGLLFLGVVASALAYLVYGYALRVLDASLVGVFTNLDPIVGVVTAVMMLGETLHTGQLLGGAIALAGMWLASMRNR